MAILHQILFCAGTFGVLKPSFRSLATLKLVVNVVGELKTKTTAATSRGSLATERLSCISTTKILTALINKKSIEILETFQEDQE